MIPITIDDIMYNTSELRKRFRLDTLDTIFGGTLNRDYIYITESEIQGRVDRLKQLSINGQIAL